MGWRFRIGRLGWMIPNSILPTGRAAAKNAKWYAMMDVIHAPRQQSRQQQPLLREPADSEHALSGCGRVSGAGVSHRRVMCPLLCSALVISLLLLDGSRRIEWNGEGIHDAMLIALSTLCQLARTKAIASVPLESVASFCSKASIWDAMAALSWRSSLRFSSSAFFSFTRATSAGDWPVDAALAADKEGCRMWPE